MPMPAVLEEAATHYDESAFCRACGSEQPLEASRHCIACGEELQICFYCTNFDHDAGLCWIDGSAPIPWAHYCGQYGPYAPDMVARPVPDTQLFLFEVEVLKVSQAEVKMAGGVLALLEQRFPGHLEADIGHTEEKGDMVELTGLRLFFPEEVFDELDLE